MLGLGVLALWAQGDASTPDCAPEALQSQQNAFAQVLTLDFVGNPSRALENLYRLGGFYQQMATRCGYQPSEEERAAAIAWVLSFASLDEIIAARAVGGDVDAVLAQLETIVGDPLNGQLLFTGQVAALDGSTLGCAGCHNGQTAPPTEGMWTRADEVRLKDPALAGYSIERYFVESILHPNAYIAPDYMPNLMPDIYGRQLDIEQLADLVAFLSSQDQLDY